MKKIEPVQLKKVRVDPEPGGTFRVVTNFGMGGFVVGGRLAKQASAYPSQKPTGLTLEGANKLAKEWEHFLDQQKRLVPAKNFKKNAPKLT